MNEDRADWNAMDPLQQIRDAWERMPHFNTSSFVLLVVGTVVFAARIFFEQMLGTTLSQADNMQAYDWQTVYGFGGSSLLHTLALNVLFVLALVLIPLKLFVSKVGLPDEGVVLARVAFGRIVLYALLWSFVLCALALGAQVVLCTGGECGLGYLLLPGLFVSLVIGYSIIGQCVQWIVPYYSPKVARSTHKVLGFVVGVLVILLLGPVVMLGLIQILGLE